MNTKTTLENKWEEKWEDGFESLQDFVNCLNVPSNASGSLGRVAASTIQRLQEEINELKRELAK